MCVSVSHGNTLRIAEVNKRRPDADGLSDARAFAERLRDGTGPSA